MLHTIKNYKRFMAGLGIASLMTLSLAAPAFAADTVTVGITGGTRTASYANLAIPAVGYSLAEQTTGPHAMTLSASDLTGTADGWNVTVVSSAFVYSGDNAGANIPAANFSFATPGTPVAADLDSQAVDATGGPKAGVGGALDLTKKVITANAGFGQGNYTQPVNASLTIPAKSRAGTYTGTLTTSIVVGP
jgi:hypothetical protein